jgi:hypothetical protein
VCVVVIPVRLCCATQSHWDGTRASEAQTLVHTIESRGLPRDRHHALVDVVWRERGQSYDGSMNWPPPDGSNMNAGQAHNQGVTLDIQT